MIPLLRSLYRFLASLKLAVVLLLSLAAILATATYYESRYDAKTAAHLVYGSWWFYTFLFMLGVNVTCAAAIRYPWKPHQTGFVITHLGIITILAGSFVTAIAGFEGNMVLGNGERSDSVILDKPTLSYQVVKGHGAADKPEVKSFPAEFRWSPPAPGSERRFALDNGLTVVVDQYLHNAMPTVRFEAGGEGDNPALQFAMKGAGGRVDMTEWLALSDPERQEMQLGPATVRFLRAPDGAALKRALAPPAKSGAAKWGLLVFEVAGAHPTIAVDGNVGKTVPLEGTPYRVRIERFMPHAVVENNKLVNRSQRIVNPAVELTVLDSKGEAERHIAFARFSDFNTAHHQKRATQLKLLYTFESPEGGNGIDVVVAPDGKLHYRIYSSSGSRSGPMEVGKAVPTGWMDLAVTATQFLPRARVITEYQAFRPARGKDGPPPAIRVLVEGADKPGPYWLQQQGDEVVVTRGKEATRLVYHLQGIKLDFSVLLKKFEVTYDPGTRNAATYASDVKVDRPGGEPLDHTISMNEPLHQNGMTFFQASFQEVDGRPAISVLQVARDPGVPIKYAGSILLVSGIAIMFFIKPFPQRRNAGAPARTATAAPQPECVPVETPG